MRCDGGASGLRVQTTEEDVERQRQKCSIVAARQFKHQINQTPMIDADMSILTNARISPTISRGRFLDGQSDGIGRIVNEKMRLYQCDKRSIDDRVGVMVGRPADTLG
jgi:hypothetical protein